jgi:hypothetical protein
MKLDADSLISAWKAGDKLPVPFFGGQEVGLSFEAEDHLREFAPSVLRFFALTTDDRDRVSHHVYAYFRDFADMIGFDAGWIESGMESITEPSSKIWEFVYPSKLSAARAWEIGNRDIERPYVDLVAGCGWEEEHGLQMSWRDGTELIKVSGYDGHVTNGHAYNDPRKDAYVYLAHNREYRTRNPLYSKR